MRTKKRAALKLTAAQRASFSASASGGLGDGSAILRAAAGVIRPDEMAGLLNDIARHVADYMARERLQRRAPSRTDELQAVADLLNILGAAIDRMQHIPPMALALSDEAGRGAPGPDLIQLRDSFADAGQRLAARLRLAHQEIQGRSGITGRPSQRNRDDFLAAVDAAVGRRVVPTPKNRATGHKAKVRALIRAICLSASPPDLPFKFPNWLKK